MTKRDEAAILGRRKFLKLASAAALGMAGNRDAFGKIAPRETATNEGHRQDDSIDRALWVTWYDLPGSHRDTYLSWLHGTYLPELLERPGYLWAAHYATRDIEGGSTSSKYHHVEDPKIPTGFHYILLIAATNALVFGNPVPSVLNATVREDGRRLLGMRTGERVNLMIEAGRSEGRARNGYKEGLTGAPCIQIGSYNCPVEYEEEMLGGYVQKRMPTMCNTGSCIRVRKLNSVAGWAKHGILYEFTSREGFNRDYAAAVAKSPLGLGEHSVVPMLIHAPNGPNSADRIWAGVRGSER